MDLIPIGKDLFDIIIGEGKYKIKSLRIEAISIIRDKLIELLDIGTPCLYFLNKSNMRPFTINVSLGYCFYKNDDADEFVDFINNSENSIVRDKISLSYEVWKLEGLGGLPKRDFPLNSYVFYGGIYDPSGITAPMIDGVYRLSLNGFEFEKEIHVKLHHLWGTTWKLCVAYDKQFTIYDKHCHRDGLHDFYLQLFYKLFKLEKGL